ncbi:hypothetical protein GCM10010520_29430 [Rhizobium viscosum]
MRNRLRPRARLWAEHDALEISEDLSYGEKMPTGKKVEATGGKPVACVPLSTRVVFCVEFIDRRDIAG